MDENWDFLCAEKKELHSCPIKKNLIQMSR